MNNPEKLTTPYTRRRQVKYKTQHRKLRRWATQTPPKTRGEPMKLGMILCGSELGLVIISYSVKSFEFKFPTLKSMFRNRNYEVYFWNTYAHCWTKQINFQWNDDQVIGPLCTIPISLAGVLSSYKNNRYYKLSIRTILHYINTLLHSFGFNVTFVWF